MPGCWDGKRFAAVAHPFAMAQARLSGMAETVRKITYQGREPGGRARIRALVQFLESGGVTVEWSPDAEPEVRSLGGDVTLVVLQVVAMGSWDAIKAAIRHYHEYFRDQADVIEVDGVPDDGGFLED